MMDTRDLDHQLVVAKVTPANDRAARILRWIGLVGGLGLCAIGRALNRRFLCYSGRERIRWEPQAAS